MQEVLQAFGIDWRLIVIQIFNFALLMAALWYFLYTPVLNILRERQQKIEQGIRDAEAAEALKSEADSMKAETLTEAHKEAENIVARAETSAKDKGVEIVSGAEDKATNILSAAEAKGEELKEKARKESEAEVAKMAILAAEKVLLEKA